LSPGLCCADMRAQVSELAGRIEESMTCNWALSASNPARTVQIYHIGSRNAGFLKQFPPGVFTFHHRFWAGTEISAPPYRLGVAFGAITVMLPSTTPTRSGLARGRSIRGGPTARRPSRAKHQTIAVSSTEMRRGLMLLEAELKRRRPEKLRPRKSYRSSIHHPQSRAGVRCDLGEGPTLCGGGSRCLGTYEGNYYRGVAMRGLSGIICGTAAGGSTV